MRKSQWIVLSLGSYFLAMLMMRISLQWKILCNTLIMQESSNTLQACVRGDIFAPFPYIFYTLSTVLFICFLLEFCKENKK